MYQTVFGFCLFRRHYSQELILLAAVTKCCPEARQVPPRYSMEAALVKAHV